MIDYHKISSAISYYESHGFKNYNLPWLADKKYIDITLPSDTSPISCNLGILIGSAEQAFFQEVHLYNLKGKYQATTPCFRDDQEDQIHQKYFLKTELFINNDVSKKNLMKLISSALDFYKKYIDVEIIQLGDNIFDIIDSKYHIELGSYGIREHYLIGSWIYGTGCAEPRLSLVQEKWKKEDV